MLRLLVAASLLLATLWVALFPASLSRVLGFSRLQTPSIDRLDARPSGEDRSAPRFLRERDEVVLTVPEAVTLDDFLRSRHLREESFRQQILRQLGVDPEAAETGDVMLEAGTELRLSLTPTAPGNR